MRFLRMLRTIPFTLSLVGALVIVAIVTGPVRGPSSLLRGMVGIDLGSFANRRWWSFLTAHFFVNNLGELLLVVLLAAIGVGTAERLMGSRRSILAFLVTGVLGSVIGLAIQAVGMVAGEYWAKSVASFVTVDPLTPIIGTVAVASAYASLLWRRRIRTFSIAATMVFLLYSGQPSDLSRLIAVLIGIGMGALLTRRRIRIAPWTSSHHETRVLLASVVAIFAVGPLITLFARGRFGLLSPLGAFVSDIITQAETAARPCTVSSVGQDCADQLARQSVQGVASIVLALVPLLVLLVGAYGLLLGRRAAVYLVALLAAVDGVLAGFYFGIVPVLGQASTAAQRAGQSPEFAIWIVANAVIPLLLAAIVLSQLRHFPVRAARRARRRFLATVATAGASATAVYLGLGWIIRDQFSPVVDFFDLLFVLPERFIPISFLLAERRDFVPATLFSRLIYHGVGPLFWLVLLIAAIMLFRGARSTRRVPGEIAEVRALLRAGGGSMSFPATWAGNSYWFDAERRVAIAYRVVNGCAVTTSEPIGHPRDPRQALGQFIRYCDTNGWTPVFYGIHGEWAALLSELGWSATVIAEETVIDPATWEMTGKKWQDVRSSVNRAAREGVHVIWGKWSSLSVGVTNQIAEISESWVVEKKLPELGFTLGGLDELRDPDVLLGVAVDSAGVVQAATSWLPTWSHGELVGYTLDFMRRRADGMNGVMEFLIAEAAVRAKLDGLEVLSLSGAPLAVAPSEDDATSLEKVLGMVGRSLEPVYGFRSLLRFKKKFQPRLVSLYVAYPDALSLPAIAIAISRCYLPALTLRESAQFVRSLR